MSHIQPPKVISEVLGHATVAFTMDVYTEVAEELADAAMEALAAYIARQPASPLTASGLCIVMRGVGTAWEPILTVDRDQLVVTTSDGFVVRRVRVVR